MARQRRTLKVGACNCTSPAFCPRIMTGLGVSTTGLWSDIIRSGTTTEVVSPRGHAIYREVHESWYTSRTGRPRGDVERPHHHHDPCEGEESRGPPLATEVAARARSRMGNRDVGLLLQQLRKPRDG